MYYDFKNRRIAQGADLDGSTLLPSIAGSATLIYVGGGGGSVFKLMGQNKARHNFFNCFLINVKFLMREDLIINFCARNRLN